VADNRRTVKRDPMLERAVQEASSEVAQLLQMHGIEDTFSVKIHPFKGYRKEWVALYRSLSQFRGNIIFWVNTGFTKICKSCGALEENTVTNLVIDSLLHEYAHVIFEWAQKRDRVLLRMIQEDYDNPEEFAESMIDILKGDMFIKGSGTIIEQFKKSAFGD
jgi:hypothetical protein